MEISKLKLAWKYMTGGITGVVDYLLDIANNAINQLSDGNKEKVQQVLTATSKVLAVADKIGWLVPSKWTAAYADTLAALNDVVNSCSDLQITKDEIDAIVTSWQKAYSAWRAD